MEGNIGKWCSFPKEQPRFEGRITHLIRYAPVVYRIEVHEIPMFKAEDEINLLENTPPLLLTI